MRATDQRGFSLVELAVVVVVVGLLVSVALPLIAEVTAANNIAATTSELRVVGEQLDMDRASTGSYPRRLDLVNAGRGVGFSAVDPESIAYSAGPGGYCLEVTPVGSDSALSIVSGQTKVFEHGCFL